MLAAEWGKMSGELWTDKKFSEDFTSGQNIAMRRPISHMLCIAASSASMLRAQAPRLRCLCKDQWWRPPHNARTW